MMNDSHQDNGSDVLDEHRLPEPTGFYGWWRAASLVKRTGAVVLIVLAVLVVLQAANDRRVVNNYAPRLSAPAVELEEANA